jgi:nucleoside 2-deoxyribosyltransferase
VSVKIFISAPLACAGRAEEAADQLRVDGFEVVSRWHSSVHREFVRTGETPPEPEGADRRRELELNLSDLRSADAVLVLLDVGRGRCALVEIGYALAEGKRVVWLGERNLADAHPNVTYAENLDAALEALKRVGAKRDDAKPRFDLIPPRAEREVAKVLEFGARKYDAENWRKVPDAERRYLGAAMRHINALRAGEENDAETGLSHLAHAICCLMFTLEVKQ